MANKKINQLVSKTAILSTDIFGIGDATTGQLFKKTIAELQAAIGGAVISVNGLVGTVVLDTDDIQELATPTNKYFTDARARGAISLTITGNSGASTYSSGTGVLNVPTYTLAGLGGITATFLSGTSGISYNSGTGVISYSGTVYTDASIRALLSAGTGISYNSSTGAISYSGTVYTDSSVRALISITTTGTSGASTYNNTTGVINVPNYTLAGLGGISLTSLSGGTGITYNNTTGAISYSGTVYTDASVRALISATGNISYNSTTGVISLSGANLTEATSSVLTITGGTGAVLGSGTTIQVKQASSTVSGFLSSTDWSTFNNKQGMITLTTTGTSGAATFTSGTLNIPQYAAALSGTTNYVAKFTSSSGIGNSVIYDDGTNLGVGTTSPNDLLELKSTSANKPNLRLYSTFNAGASAYGINWYRDYDSATNAIAGYIRYNRGGGSDGDMLFGTGTNSGVSERMRITSAGNVGINEVSPTRRLSITDSLGTDIPIILLTNNTTSTFAQSIVSLAPNLPTTNNFTGYVVGKAFNQYNCAYLSFYYAGNNSSDNALVLGGHSLDNKFLLKMNGNVLIGTATDNGERLYVSGAIRATGTITANSDLTLKKNLLKIENALEKVEQINGYTYEFKENDSKRHAGVIAQEIQTVLPEIVNKGNDGILGVEYGNISALLIEAIKEQNTKIKNLETLLASK